MNIAAIFLLLTVIVVVGLFVARPFLEGRRAVIVSADEKEISALMAERDRMITALQELDFDHTLGKIPSEDYPSMRADLMRRAAEVLQKLDISRADKSTPADIESRLEAVIAARRTDAAAQKSASSDLESDDIVEALIASRKAARKEQSTGFCPQCGKAILHSDRFCPQCGKAVN
jgi:hypothetical protein